MVLRFLLARGVLMESEIATQEQEDRTIIRNVLAIAITWGIVFPLFTMETQYEQIYLVVLGASPSMVGLIYGVSIIALAFARLIGGYLADVIGRKRTIYIFTYIVALLYFIPVMYADWRILAVALILINVSFLFQPAISAIMADSTSPKTRGRLYSIMNTVSLLSTIPAPIIAVQIISQKGIVEGMRFIYFIIAIGFLFAAVIRHFLMVETIKNDGETIHSFDKALNDYKEALKYVLDNLRWPLVARIVMFIAGFAVLSFTGIYISETLGFGRTYWGQVYFYANLITVIVVVVLGNLSDKIDRRIPIIAVLLAYIPSVYLLSIVDKLGNTLVFPAIVISVSSILIVNNTAFTVLFALEADLIPKNIRGKTQAILALAGSSTSAITQTIYGRIYEIDPKLVFEITAVIILVGTLYLISRVHGRQVKKINRN